MKKNIREILREEVEKKPALKNDYIGLGKQVLKYFMIGAIIGSLITYNILK